MKKFCSPSNIPASRQIDDVRVGIEHIFPGEHLGKNGFIGKNVRDGY